MSTEKGYEVVIVGGGVTGTALLWMLAFYTNVRRILLIERREGVARVNSSVINNSQTLHSGEIETNFSLEKARTVQKAARLLIGYVERHAPGSYMRLGKMVIGVGAEEAAELTARYEIFKPYFPHMELIGRDRIAAIEPKVILGRDPAEPIVALYSSHGFAMNYQAVSESFRAGAARSSKGVEVILERDVSRIVKAETGGYVIKTENGDIRAKAVAVCAGGGSLNFAHDLGYAKDITLLPVAGSFYKAKHVLNGKVYTVQLPKIPFAANHGDPAVYDRDETRFGPTAIPLPMTERHRYSTVWEFVRSGALRAAAIWTLIRVLWDSDIAAFAARNFLYEIPFLGKWLFLKSCRKIVPSLRYRDIKLARGAGGIRSQPVDVRRHVLAKGMDKFVGDGIIFTLAPSPGASYCLGNAQEDAETLMGFLGEGYAFDKARLHADLLGEEDPALTEGAAP